MAKKADQSFPVWLKKQREDQGPVVCIGEILWDIYPEEKYPGGAPFNVACHLHMMGVPVLMVSRVGQDDLGEALLSIVARKGMDSSGIQVDETRATGTVHVSLDSRGHPQFDISWPSAWDFIELTGSLALGMQKARAVVFGTLAQRHAVSRATILTLVEKSPFRVLDINFRSPYVSKPIVERSLQLAHLVKMNREELQQLQDWWALPASLESAVEALARTYQLEAVCVTLGEQGARLFFRDRWFSHPGYRIQVKDTVGAGDAFLAALLTGWFSRQPGEELLAFANAVAAYVATQPGATPTYSWMEIRRLMEN